jgi:DNA-binding Lrp family transcriptional regulator
MMIEKLDDVAKRVLSALNDGSVMSGSQLARYTSLTPVALRGAVEILVKRGLITYRGDLGPDGFPDAMITVQPSARDASDFLLKQ